jgi:hypothetical protein
MGKADGLQEPRLPTAPEQLIEIYDDVGNLMDLIIDFSKPIELMQLALNRTKDLIPVEQVTREGL